MRFLQSIFALLLGLLLVQLSSCAGGHELAGRDQVADVLSQPLDSAVQHQAHLNQLYTLPVLSTGRLKFNGPVTFQVGGTGNNASSTSADKAKAPVAAAPHAVATETITATGTPWYVYLGLVVVGILLGVLALGYWLIKKLPPFPYL